MEALRKCEIMSELLQSVLRAHGGIDRWNKFTTVSALFVTGGGGLMPMNAVDRLLISLDIKDFELSAKEY